MVESTIRGVPACGGTSETIGMGTDVTAGVTCAVLGLRNRRQQLPGVLVLRAGEHLVGIALLDDPALVHHRHPMRQVLDHRQVVADEQVRQSELVLQIQQQVHDAGLDGHIERRHRFVECEDLRVQRQRPCDTDALLLAAGELGWGSGWRPRVAAPRCRAAQPPATGCRSCRNRWPATVPPVCRTPATGDPGRRPDPGKPPAGRGAAPVAARCPGSRRRCRAPRWFPPGVAVSSRISCSVVDLPDPDSPTIPNVWPRWSSKLTPSTARTSPMCRRNTTPLVSR